MKILENYPYVLTGPLFVGLMMEYKDHQLTGKLKKEDSGELHILNLVRTGTHSDLFKK